MWKDKAIRNLFKDQHPGNCQYNLMDIMDPQNYSVEIMY